MNSPVGESMLSLMRALFPLCRSITGAGLRQTLAEIAREFPLEIHEVATGTQAFDWEVPREWSIRDAYVADKHGRRIIDFQAHNLHVVNYSAPVKAKMTLAQLRPHLHTLPDHPDWIPYRTTYYRETWGFCLPHRVLEQMTEQEYEVCVDSELALGALTYGELRVPGESDEELLISTHVCHPSLANDNLSGIAMSRALARHFLKHKPKRSMVFLFIPGTLGSIVWLSRNTDRAKRLRAGLVLTGLGGPGPLTFKRSRRGDSCVDKAAAYVLDGDFPGSRFLDFSPYGYDERQYCSPGFNLAVGRLTRTPHGEYPEYHTSADNLDFIRPQALEEAYQACRALLETLDADGTYINTQPYCEPQLGKRGLYRDMGGFTDAVERDLALLWTLNLTDGTHSLLDIAEKSKLPFPAIVAARDSLERAGLLRARI